MSGGHYDYKYAQIEYTYENELEYPVLDSLLKDFCKLLKSLEWYKSGDTSKEDYKKDAEAFIKKWIKGDEGKEIKAKSDVIVRFQDLIDTLKEEID